MKSFYHAAVYLSVPIFGDGIFPIDEVDLLMRAIPFGVAKYAAGIATTVAEGCVFGAEISMSASADDLKNAYTKKKLLLEIIPKCDTMCGLKIGCNGSQPM